MTDTITMTGNDLKNYAYNILKERLISCTYAPGSILNEAHLTSELKLSRTPVREAVSRLETEGFLKVLPKKGIHVTDILLSDVLQIFQIRTEFEPIILRLSASRLPKDELLYFCKRFEEPDPDETLMDRLRLDTAMHLFIIEHCGNRYIIDMMHRIFDENTRVIISSKQNQVQIHDARLEHLDILNSLLDKDTERAIALMQSHIENCRKAALDYFCSIQTYMDSPSLTYKNQLAQL